MDKNQIGALGVLKVQSDVLSLGVDSARLTTDYGVDLVAYGLHLKKPITIQVKATAGAKHRERAKRVAWPLTKGKEGLADVFAFVDVRTQDKDIWYLTRRDFAKLKFDQEPKKIWVSIIKAGRASNSGRVRTELEMQQFKGTPRLEKLLRDFRLVAHQ